MQSRNFGLDVLRAAAIVSVLFLHCNYAAPDLSIQAQRVFAFGWVGVDLFFVLSGYLIASQVMRPVSASSLVSMMNGIGCWNAVREFWIRRWTRTLPLYFLVLIIYVWVKPAFFGSPFVGWSPKYLFFVQNYGDLRDFDQSWSLCIEEQFYFFFPLIFYFAPAISRRPVFWLLPWGASLALRAAFAWQHGLAGLSFEPVFRFQTVYHLDGISLGVFLAATRAYWCDWSASLKRGLAAIGILGLGLTSLAFGAHPTGWGAIFFFTALSISFSLLLIGAEGVSYRPWGGIWIERIALMSYGAYLWNNLLIRWFQRHPLPLPAALQAAIFVLATFCLAWGTYRLVELPGMRLRRILSADLKRPAD